MQARWKSVGVGCVTGLALSALLTSSAFACCRNYEEFAAQCRAQGGIPGMGATCKPASSGGLSGYSGGRASASQQQMLGLAGALGAAFGNLLREQEANAALARQQAMEQAAVEMARFQAEEQERMRQLEARHQNLLANLKGGLGHSELGLKPLGTGTLELKGGTALFGESNAIGTLTYGEETAGLTLKMPDAPTPPKGKLVGPALLEAALVDYYRAADAYAQADLRRQRLEEEKALAERIRIEAEKNYREHQQRAALLLQEQAAKPDQDNQLAEAEKLLNEAIAFDRKATQDLDKAKQDLEHAKLTLDRTKADRANAEKSLAQADQGVVR